MVGRMARRVPLLLLLGLAQAAPPGEREPPCRCLVAAMPPGLATCADTGLPQLDRRIRSERNFLRSLFGVDPAFVLLDEGAPRDAFTVASADGHTVAVRAGWLRDFWSEDNRAANVAAAIAHQYAHVLQDARKCKLPEMARELQADLLAGWYLGTRNIATPKGDELDAAFAASLFAKPDGVLNARFEHGAPDARVRAISEGFRLFRREKLPLAKVYAYGLERFPPPKVGTVEGPPPPPGVRMRKEKVECVHRVACEHHVDCEHPQPCIHQVPCKHESPCVHRSPCIHMVPCVHRQACVHRVECRHKVDCVHTIPCVHAEHECDYLHEFDRDWRGNRVACIHSVPCTHFLHRCDFLHNFDYAHDWDFEHEFDPLHDYDMAHDFDTEHDFDPVHDFDMAHPWDPVHDFDLAHEWDPAHDYDVQVVPAAEGAAD